MNNREKENQNVSAELVDAFFSDPRNLSIIIGEARQTVGQVSCNSVPLPEDKSLSEECRIVEMQRKVEQCFSGFSQQINDALDQRTRQHGNDETFNIAIKNPFFFIENNRKNKYSNASVARREARQKNVHVFYIAEEKLHDKRQFVYDIDKGELDAMQGFAGFAPLGRSLVLPANFDPNNPLHFLVVCHETVHAMHTAHWLMSDKEGFMRFYNRKKPASILNEEYDAYALEIEMLNLLLNGGLKQSISAGMLPDANAIADRLGIPKQEIKPLRLILNLAGKYYPSGSVTVAQKPPEFIGYVASNQHSYGYDIYVRNGNKLIQIKE